MEALSDQLDRIFDVSFPKQIQEAILKCLFDAYAIASDECSKFPKEEAHDLFPFLRWIQLRTLLRGLADRFESVEAQVEPNGTASSYHVCINAGQVKLTASTVDDPSALPPFANYRAEYAAQSQLDLFEDNDPFPPDGKIYVILTHGKDQLNRRQPAFARIIFPEKDCQSFVHRIDLFERHKELVDSLIAPQIQEPQAKLQRQEKKKNES